MAKRKSRKKTGVEKGRVRVYDPFELVRWLALSQPDPRKALAELVQNSLDARSRSIRITRVRERKVPCLKILDDGEGVIPELSRPEALRYINRLSDLLFVLSRYENDLGAADILWIPGKNR